MGRSPPNPNPLGPHRTPTHSHPPPRRAPRLGPGSAPGLGLSACRPPPLSHRRTGKTGGRRLRSSHDPDAAGFGEVNLYVAPVPGLVVPAAPPLHGDLRLALAGPRAVVRPAGARSGAGPCRTAWVRDQTRARRSGKLVDDRRRRISRGRRARVDHRPPRRPDHHRRPGEVPRRPRTASASASSSGTGKQSDVSHTVEARAAVSRLS